MFTHIDKNLLIAAMESAIYHACVNANVVSLHAIETGVSALRQRFDANPESVTDDDVFGMVDTIERAAIPPLATIDAINNDTSIVDRVVSYLWRNIVDKPTTFPPATHAHDYASITSKPATFPPDAHAHDYASITSKPATFPPDAHTHDYASITEKPDTFALIFASVSFVGTGATSRNISYSPASNIRSVVGRRTDGLCFLWWVGLDSLLSFGIPGVMTINSAGWNQSGSTYNLILLP